MQCDGVLGTGNTTPFAARVSARQVRGNAMDRMQHYTSLHRISLVGIYLNLCISSGAQELDLFLLGRRKRAVAKNSDVDRDK